MAVLEQRKDKLFSEKVNEKEKRKLKAKQENKKSIWFGIGMFGMIGWSVAIPALIGAAIGLWLDKIYTQPFSWTITLLIAGLVSGCVIAWFWMHKEENEMNQNKNGKNE